MSLQLVKFGRFLPLLFQVAKVQEDLKREKERTGNVTNKMASGIKEKCEKDNREERDKHKEMFRAALARAQMAEKKLEETQVELAKFKDLNHVATMQIKVLNKKIQNPNEESEVHVLQALNKQVREEKEVLQAEVAAQEEQNKKLCDEKEVLQAEVAAIQEKVNFAEVSLSRHLEKEIVSKQGELISMGEVLSDSNKSLLAEVKRGFQGMIDKITAPIDARLKNFDDKVSELVSDKLALEGGLEKDLQPEELEKLRNNRVELTKVVERLTAALKDLKEEKAELEKELKEAQEKAANAGEMQKEDSSAEVNILNAENAALRKDVMALAAEMRNLTKLHAEKAEVHQRLVKKLGKEKRHLEARLEAAKLNLVLERKSWKRGQLVAQPRLKHLGMDQTPPPKISQEGQMAANSLSEEQR